MKRELSLSMAALLLASSVSVVSAMPTTITLRPISTVPSNIWGTASIDCSKPRQTLYTFDLHNLAPNTYQAVLETSSLDRKAIGTIQIVKSDERTVSAFPVPMSCPLGTSSRILILQGATTVLSGSLSGADSR
jgi:hypothetical protein